MTLQEIKDAVNSGEKVYWKNLNYEVIKDSKDQWLIKCHSNNSCIGLFWTDEITLNGKESEFFQDTDH